MRRLLLASLLVAIPVAAHARNEPSRPLQDAERGRAQAQAQAREAAERARAAAAEEQRLATARVSEAVRLRATENEVADRAAEVTALAEQRADAEARLVRH